jgi:hypothetical protein
MSRDLQEGRHWNPESLAALQNARFVPLGHLPAGRYRATLGMNGQIAFFFVVDRSSVHYLRLKSSKAQTLSSLDIQTAD